MNKNKLIGLIILTLAFGTIFGSLLGGYFVYNRFESQYFKLYNTNIGYFLFRGSKIYSLEEMKVLNQR